jgi:TRAP-type C4-dicarboxylate transport system substrate-binding protein
LMNKQSYAQLTPELKHVIDANSGEWLAKEFGRRWEHDDQPGIARANKLGHPIIVVSKAEQARWREATEPVYQSWIEDMNAKGLPGSEMVAAAEQLVAEYKAQAKVQ